MSASSSMASLSRRLVLSRSLFHSKPTTSVVSTRLLYTTTASESSDSDDPIISDLDFDPTPPPPQPSAPRTTPPGRSGPSGTRVVHETLLENGLDVGIYKAILVGQVGVTPFEKRMRSGAALAMFSLGTGGIRNNRRPFEFENPAEYADRCAVQWHRVIVYSYILGKLLVQNAKEGSIIYVEGNLETKIYCDPVDGIVRRVREIAVRRNGRIVFLGNGNDAQPTTHSLRGVGYH